MEGSLRVGGGAGLLLLTLLFDAIILCHPPPKGYPLAAIDFDAKDIVFLNRKLKGPGWALDLENRQTSIVKYSTV